YSMTTDLLLSKGLYHRPPYINAPQEAMDFIKSTHFLTGYSSPDRTLNAIEINNIFFNLKKSMITKAMILSFSQTAQTQEVRKFFVKAVEIKSKHIKIFSDILTADNLSAPPI